MRVLPQFRLRSVVIGCRAALRQTTLWTAVFGMLVTPYAPAYAAELPEGAVVESGDVSINPISATRLQINQTTQSGVINWRSFSISEDARVDFVQPNSSASTLNRVTGGQVSQIRGQLNANGRVVLVNPAGILFTANAEVNVGALIASTLDISTQDFLSGQETYSGASTNAVINQGKLKANAGGYIAMVAAQVTNAGTIESPSGSVLLAAGQRVQLDMGGPLQIEVEAGALDAHIESGGGIRASDGLVYLTAKAANDLLASAINHTGIIEASSLTSVGGRVVLEADAVTLAAGSSLSATGATGGGDVLVGGDWQGGNNAARGVFDNPEQLREATTVTMEAGASIDASATDRGDGGTVVLWSDISNANSVTSAQGAVAVKGGSQGGDGGQIETSGYDLKVDGITISTQANEAAGGRSGEWLLDPRNITISTGTDSNVSGQTATGDSAIINVNTLTTALNSSNVTVFTGTTGTQPGTITVDSAITAGGANTLTLKAASGIVINADITRTDSGGLTLRPGYASATRTVSGSGTLNLSGGTSLLLSSGTTLSNNINIGSGGATLGFAGLEVEYLIVGGGGGGGGGSYNYRDTGQVAEGGDGGAGGRVITGSTTTSVGTSVTVGSGGAGGIAGMRDDNNVADYGFSRPNTPGGTSGANNGGFGSSGGDSTAFSLTAQGGAGGDGGLGYPVTSQNGVQGASSSSTTVSAITAVNSGTSSSITGSTISYGDGGGGGRIRSSSDGSTSSYPGSGGGGGSGYDDSGTGGNSGNAGSLAKATGDRGQAGVVVIRYAGPDAASGGSESTITANGVEYSVHTFTSSSGFAINSFSAALSGTISGAGALTVDASGGAMTLSGSSTYTGSTTLAGGALKADSSAALGSGSAVTLNNVSGASLTLLRDLSVGSLAGSGTTGGHIALGGNTLTAGGNNTSTTYAGVISGVGSLIKQGTGILTLSGGSTYSGNTTVSGGTLQVGSAATLGGGTYSGALSITSGATFDYASTAAQLLTGTVSGAGAVLKSGAGRLSLLGNNTFSGGVTLSAGTLGVYTNTGAGTGDITLGAGTAMLLGRAVTSIANDITLSGAASIGFDTSVEYLVVGGGGGGGAFIGGGGGGGQVLTGSSQVAGGTDLSVVVGAGGSGAKNKGVFVGFLAASSGGTSSLQIGTQSALLALGGGAGASHERAVTGAATGGGGGGALGADTVGDGVVSDGGQGFGADSYTGGGGGGAGGNGGAGTPIAGGNGGAGLASGITGTSAYYGGGGGGGVHGANGTFGTYTAGNGGLGGGGSGAKPTSQLGAETVIGTSGTDGLGGGGGGAGKNSGAQPAAGQSYTSIGGDGGSGTVIVRYLGGSADNSAGTALNITGYTAQRFSSSSTLSMDAIDINLSGVVSGANALTLDATGGTLTLSGSSTYTGSTTLAGGALKADSSAALGSGSAVTLNNVSGASLTLLRDLSVGSLAGSGTTGGHIALGGNTLTAGGNNTSTTYAGVISGVGSLIKQGTGILTLSGGSTYSGNTTVSGGTLQVGSAATLGGGTYSGALSITSGATFDYASTAAQLLTGTVSGAGAVLKSGAGSLTLTGTNTYTGTTTVSAGTLQLGNNTATGTITSDVVNNAAMVFDYSADVSMGIDISGTGTVDVVGRSQALFANYLTTSAQTVASNASVAEVVNRLSGVVNGGAQFSSLEIGGGVYHAAYDPLTNAATFQTQLYDGTYTKVVFVKLEQSGTDVTASVYKGRGNLYTLYRTGNYLGSDFTTATYTGAVNNGVPATSISAAGYGVAQLNYGTKLTLTGALTHTGTTTLTNSDVGTAASGVAATGSAPWYVQVAPATLEIGGAGTLTSSAVTNNGNLIFASSVDQTLSGVISGAGSVFKRGSGQQTFSANNTYVGATNVQAGTLTITGGIYCASAAACSTGTPVGNNTAAITTVSSGATLEVSDWGWGGSLGTRYYESAALVLDGGTLRFSGASDSASARGFTVTSAGATFDSATAGVTWEMGAASTTTYKSVFGGDLLFKGAGNTSFAQLIAGAGVSVTKEGAGTLTLSGANTYAGGTTLSAGVVKAGVSSVGGVTSGALGQGLVTVASGSALDVAGYTVSNALSIAGTGLSDSGAVYTSSANAMTLAGAVTLTGNASIKSESGGALTLNGAINGGYALTVDANGSAADAAFTLGGVVGGSTALSAFSVDSGTANVSLNAGVTVAGPVQVVGNDITINASLNTSTGGASGDVLFKASGGVTLGANQSITTSGGDAVIWADSDANGAGRVVFTANTRNTNTIVTNGGHIYIGGGAAENDLPSGAAQGGASIGVSLNNGSTFLSTFDTSKTGAAAGNVTIAGLSTSDDGVHMRNIKVVAHDLTIGGQTSTRGKYGVSLWANNSGGTNFALAGDLVINGTNSAGSTSTDYSLRTGANPTLSVQGNTTINSTGYLEYNSSQTNLNVAADKAFTFNITGDALVSTPIGGDGGLVKSGMGTLRITGSNTYSGGTTLSAGILKAGVSSLGSVTSGAFGTSGVAVASGAALDVAGFTVANVLSLAGTGVSGSGAVYNSTSTPGTLSGAMTLVGDTSIKGNAGALTISGAINGAHALDITTTNKTFTQSGVVGATSAPTGFTVNAGTGNVTLGAAQTVAGPMTVYGGEVTLSAGTTLTAGAGSDIVLVASGDFINNAGASALAVSGGGRWIVYAGDTTGNTYGSLNSGNQGVFNKTYATLAPASVAAGNRYVIGNAGSQTITVTTTDATKFYGDTIALSSNYTLTSSGISGVSGVYLGVSATAGSVTSADVFATAPTVTSTGAPVTQNVGTASITASGGVANTGYTLAYSNTGTLTITRRPITVTATDKTKVYSDANPALTYTLIDNDGDSTLPNGDALGGSLTTSVTSTTGAGTWAGSITRGSLGATGANYDISFIAGSFEVTPKALSVSGLTVADKVYDGTTTASISAAGNLVGKVVADDVSYVQTGAAFIDKNAGVGKTVTVSGISLSGADAGNYSIASTATTTADITVKALTLSGFTAANKVYDGLITATISNAGSLTGVVGSEDVSFANGSATFGDKNVALGKTVTMAGLSLSGADAGNYSIASTATTTADITVKALILSGFAAATKVYDGLTTATISSAGSLVGLVAGDTVTVSNGGASFEDKNAATGKMVTLASVSLGGADGSNYSIASTATTTADITAKALTLSGFTAANKVYDGSTTATISSAGSLVGLVTGDTVTVSNAGASFANKNAATGKTVTLAGVSLGGADGGNYSITSTATTTADITAKALTLSGFAAANKVYDGLTTATISSAGSLVGVVAGDTVTVSNAGASFANKSAATGKTVTLASVSLGGADGSNYSIASTATTTADITAKALTLSGFTAANKVYDGLTTATISSAGSLVGVVAGDTVTVSNAGASFANKSAATGKTVTLASVSLGGADGSNYSIASTATTTANITPKTITLSATKTYDGTTDLTGAVTLGGTVGSETLTYAGALAASARVAGPDLDPVTVDNYVSALTLLDGTNGGEAANYQLPTLNAANAPLQITAAPLVVSLSNTGVTKVYDGTANAPSGFAPAFTTSGLVAGDTLTYGFTDNAYNNAGVSTASQITVSGLRMGGISSSNGSLLSDYTLSGVSSVSVAATVTRAPLSVVANADAKFVTTTDTAGFNGVTYNGFVNGETASDLAGTLAITRTNASNDLADRYSGVLVPSGLTSSNYQLSFVNGDFTVVPADELLVRLSAASDTYGTATSYAINSIGYYNASQVQVVSLAGTSSIGASNLVTVADGAGGTASFTVGPSNPVYSSSGKLAVGGYNLGLTGLVTENSGNFSDTVTVIGSHQVNQKTISVNASGVTKTYDGTTSMDGVTIGLSGVETSDTVTVSGIGAFDAKSAAASAAYTLSNLEIAGADADNYVLATGRTATGNGTINPYALTLGFTGVDKVYNGTTTASVTVTDNRIAGDVITLTPSATFANKNVGASKVVTVSNVVLGGTDSANYSVSNSSGTASAAITQLASVTWTGNGGNLNWFDPANWDGAVPDLANVASVVIPSGVDVVFDTSAATGLAETGTVNLTSVGSLGSLTMAAGSLAVGSGGLNLAGLTQGGGTLSALGAVNVGSLAQTGGALAASGALTVTSGFTQGTSGSVTVGGNASITDTSGGTSVGNLSVTGTLGINSTAGAITQAAGSTITAGGATSLLAYDGSTSYFDVTLNGIANDFASAVSVTADNVVLTDTNNLTLAATTTSGDLTVNTGAALSLSSNVTVGGNAALDATGAVVQTGGTLAVTGTTALEAGTNISLSEATNSFGGAVAVSGATDVDLVSTGGVTLAAVTATGGLSVRAVTGNVGLSGVVSVASLSAVSTAGAITQSGGSVAVTTGTTNLTAATDITLSQSSNDFASTVNATGRDIDIEDANALTLGAVDASGSVAVLSTGHLALGGNVQGTLITAASSAGALTAGTLTATAGAIDLDAAGAVTLNGNVTSAAAVTVDSSAGAVSQTAGTTLTASGSAVVNAAADVSLAGAVSAALVDVDATGGSLSVNDLTATSGALTLDATGAVSVVGDLTAATTLGVRSSAGGVTQSTGSTMSGGGSLTVSSRNNATLAGTVTGASVTAASTAGALTVSSLNATTGAIDLDAAGAVRLNGNVTAANGLTVDTTSGGITQVGGNITVAAGVTSLAATTDITLETTTNRFAGAVNANGANINLAAAGNLSIGAVSASGDAALSATNTLNLNGNITAQAVTGRSTAGDVNVGNVIANTTMTLEALRTVTMTGTIGVQSNLNVTAGRGVIQQPTGVLTVTTGPAVMSALYGNVDLLNRASIPGLVIEDDRIRLARSGGVMNAIRDYLPVSQQMAVPAAPRVDNLTQSDLTAGRNVGGASGVNPLVSTPVVSATSIGSTGKVFKLFSMDEARTMQLMPPTSAVAPGVIAPNQDALPAPTTQTEVVGQTESNTSAEASFTMPAFLGRGEIIVVEGGIATPAIAVVNRVISDSADRRTQSPGATAPRGANVKPQEATGAGTGRESEKEPLALIN